VDQQKLTEIIAEKMKEIEAVAGADPWVTRTPEEAANYLAGYTRALEDAAEIADKWGSGKWQVESRNGRSRFTLRDLQAQTNTTGRAIAEDIRALSPSKTGP
jgi:hypothetical protein